MADNYGDDLLYWLWMTEKKGIGPRRQHLLLEYVKNPKQLYQQLLEMPMPENDGKSKCVLEQTMDTLRKNMDLDPARRILDECEKNGIRIVTLENGLPERFREFQNLPTHLYVKGSEKELLPGYGITGARNYTERGEHEAMRMTYEAGQRGNPIVTGFADGINRIVLECAVENPEYLVYAVMSSGLDRKMSQSRLELCEDIMEKGLLISEYPPGMPSLWFHFPARNRIIAGLSNELHVIDTNEEAGGLVSVIEAAKKYNVPCICL